MPDCFIQFQCPVDDWPLPERFTFPFHYTPHPLCVQAAAELRQLLSTQTGWDHNFGHEPEKEGDVYGKMFGVLVVQNSAKKLGYLAAFSGKLAGKSHHPGFVPPVFDLLDEDGFYRKEEAKLNDLNRQIEYLEDGPKLNELLQLLESETAAAALQLEQEKQRLKIAKAERQQRRETAAAWSPEAFQTLETDLTEESKRDHFVLKDLKKRWNQTLHDLQAQVDPLLVEIQALKAQRRTQSAALQQRIFDQYLFLNQHGQQKSLADIFQRNAATPPPSGAGECAAPKLLQYAFLHHLKPVCMAEFWWGESPVGEIRKHGHFYPACRGKCEPILAHMLQSIDMDENPMSTHTAAEAEISMLYEDAYLLVLNKPPALLSVPGKDTTDSVYFRMKQQYPEATGPLIVHRLDMSTSGIMLLAKTAEVHKDLQSQFLRRSIKKRYTALLEGLVPGDEGVIDLPLRVDLDDRPHQMVCYEYGKAARTEWKVIAREDGKTRIHFFPVTGRTHQLRVHAAHPKGLNAPILGDELYGNPAERLYLHAECLEFTHPISGKQMIIEAKADF